MRQHATNPTIDLTTVLSTIAQDIARTSPDALELMAMDPFEVANRLEFKAWADDNWPDGNWHCDRAKFEGVGPAVYALIRQSVVQLGVWYDATSETYRITVGRPVPLGPDVWHDQTTYPKTMDPAKTSKMLDRLVRTWAVNFAGMVRDGMVLTVAHVPGIVRVSVHERADIKALAESLGPDIMRDLLNPEPLVPDVPLGGPYPL